MKKVNKLKFLFFAVLMIIIITVKAQEQKETEKELADTVSVVNQEKIAKKKDFKNIIRYNLSNPALISPNFRVFGYERVLKNNQSFSINIGTFGLPKFFGSLGDSLKLLEKNQKDRGFHFSVDYRFYLKKENKYPAPRGLYIGPYYSINHMSRENKWSLNTENFNGDVKTKLGININTIGAEMGYQFVICKRLTFDFILLGPGVGFYSLNAKLDTSLSPDDESMFFQKLNDLLAEKIPGYDKVIQPAEFSKKGSFKTTTLGFRYLVQIGFRF